jgi:two-component system nitrogen regulation response regulator NtrX
VLITGPAGVGKEVAARLLHSWSGRADAVHHRHRRPHGPERSRRSCSAWRIESGLVRPGYLEQAHGGTLYLDEVADMPLTTQGKILRVLTDQSFTRVSGQRQVKVDVRVISSTAHRPYDRD